MNNVVPFTAAVRGHSGRSRAYPTQNPTLAGKCQEAAVQALLSRLDDLHSKHCHCIGIAYRCRPLERRLMAALKALEHGSSVDEAIEVAGSFGLLGSVEVMQ